MPDVFKAATWNLLHTVPAAQQAAPLAKARHHGVTLFLIQEADAPGIQQVFRDAGLETFLHPRQYMLAWDPAAWMARATWGTRLAPTPYYAKGSSHEMYSEAAMAILCDEKGRTLTAMSYHTPAAVQVPTSQATQHREQVTREAAATWGELARGAKTHACLFGGDDNVDEGRGGPRRWGFLLRAATGLRQVQAPSGTHGQRRIDDFRVRGRLRVGDGWVMDTPGDHRLHGRTFSWR